MLKPKTKQTLHVFNLTHWDREWLLPLVTYRQHLLHHNDFLIELMERDPAYRHYQMDGQSICMEDYLRLRPEMEPRLRKLIRAGRILVGPWYTLPDMPLLHGEAVARNLLVGIALSESLGGAMREGYTACSNGQIAQLPQIYNGFDVRSAVLYKGISDQRAPREFRWQSPDGSEVLALHLAARYGRSNFYCMLYHEVISNVIHDTPDQNWEYGYAENRYPFRVDGLIFSNPHRYTALNDLEAWYPQHLRPYLAKLREQAARDAATSHLAGFHCMDHTLPFPATPKLIAAANQIFPDLAVKDSTLPAYFAAVRREAGTNLPVHVGELRDPRMVALDREIWWPTLSVRMNVKIANRVAEHQLIDTAEPACTLAWLRGAAGYPAASLTEAWKLLLACHAHDSIDACSVDKVCDDIKGRLSDVHAMSESLLEEACHALIRPALSATRHRGRMPEPHLAIFNFDTRTRGGFCEVEVDLPQPAASDHLKLVTPAGEEIVPHVEKLFDGSAELGALVGRPMATRRCRLLFDTPAIAPMTWLALKMAPAPAPRKSASLLRDGRVLENEHLRAVVRDDGRLDLTHKATGATYPGVHYFEDVGDASDPWHFCPTGATVTSAGPAEITVVEENPWRAAIEVKLAMDLPEDGAAAAGTRPERRRLTIWSRFSLTRTGRRIDVETRMDNTCRNHRLRVCLPSGITTDTTYAGGQFRVDERPTRLPDMTHWLERVDGYPNYGFAGLSDGRRGLAILNLGLPEYFVSGPQQDVLTLTLLRCMRLQRRPEVCGEEYATGLQQPGLRTARYAIYPHAGGWREGGLWEAYRDFARKLVCAVSIGAVHSGGPGLLALDGAAELQVSCVKKAEREEALVVRVWNPTDQAQPGRLTLRRPFRGVVVTNLNEEPRPDPAVRLRVTGGRSASFTVGAGKIITLLFRMGSGARNATKR